MEAAVGRYDPLMWTMMHRSRYTLLHREGHMRRLLHARVPQKEEWKREIVRVPSREAHKPSHAR